MVPRVGEALAAAAVRLQDQAAYAATVLNGAHVTHPAAPFPPGAADVTISSAVTAVCSALGAAGLALAALYWRRLPLLRRGYEPGAAPAAVTAAILRFQSGVINDYITWIVTGLACLGGRVPAGQVAADPSAWQQRGEQIRQRLAAIQRRPEELRADRRGTPAAPGDRLTSAQGYAIASRAAAEQAAAAGARAFRTSAQPMSALPAARSIRGSRVRRQGRARTAGSRPSGGGQCGYPARRERAIAAAGA